MVEEACKKITIFSGILIFNSFPSFFKYDYGDNVRDDGDDYSNGGDYGGSCGLISAVVVVVMALLIAEPALGKVFLLELCTCVLRGYMQCVLFLFSLIIL